MGTYENYIPWHRVSRSDPSSMGRSHLQLWRGRQRELLSDQELVALLFSTMHPDVVDIREQFALNLHSCSHELNSYQIGSRTGAFSGTIELAEQMKMKHPTVSEHGIAAPWIMTTDLLLTLRTHEGFQLLAISVKPSNVWTGKRTKFLLGLEREYWACRNVPWLLITQSLYDTQVADLLKGNSYWALGGTDSALLAHWLCQHVQDFNQRDLTHVLRKIEQYCGCPETAKLGFWGAVWTGKLPFDLRRSWRPSSPLILLAEQEFWEINPIVSGRSAWQA
ncbi:TnsA endonuclease N-terminal domain-containing protein [Oxalobacteraceae bacterium]|nr:TnsA endonuclease N-terminal domain-containing protein [Oxalobacteraceae bacterium]